MPKTRGTLGAVGAAWLVLLGTGVALATPGNDAASWAGTWRGGDLVVTLAANGDAMTGTLQRGAQSFPLTATVTPNGLAGTFESHGYRYPFTLRRTEAGATLTTGGATYALARAPGEGPAARPKAPAPAPTPAATPAGWKPYKHPLGYTVDLPGDWKVQAVDEDTLALIPDDLQRGANGAEEVLLLAGLPAEGVRDPADPRVAAALDGHVRSLFPGVAREGQTESVRLGPHPAAVLRWSGKAPTGVPLRASVVTLIHQNTAIALLLASRPGRAKRREQTARRILASLRLGRSVVDPTLVGFWRREKTYFSPGRGDFSSTQIDEMLLRADGTFAFQSQTLVASRQRSEGGDDLGTVNKHLKGDEQDGRWSAVRSPAWTLRLVWKDGNEARYRVERNGNAMLLVGDDGTKLLYERVK